MTLSSTTSTFPYGPTVPRLGGSACGQGTAPVPPAKPGSPVFDSLQAVAKHRRDKNENSRNVKIICGQCGELFRTMEDLAL